MQKLKEYKDYYGHSKASTTLDIYADTTDDIKKNTIELIEDYITSISDENIEKDIIQNIQQTDIYSLEKQEVTKLKNQLIRNLNISKLEEEVKQVIMKLSISPSNIGDTALSSEYRLQIIYQMLNNIEQLKMQTRNIRKDTDSCNNDYGYTLNYLITAQSLLKTIYKYSSSKQKEQTIT